jgi:hypothetical protein
LKETLIRASLAISRVFLLVGLVSTLGVTVVFVYHIASNVRSDTTSITNGAFIFCGTLSALCFAWAQALLPEEKDRQGVIFSGERLLHASVFLVIASILKYAALTMATYEMADFARAVARIVGDIFGVLAAPLFLFAIGNAFAGILTVYRILWPRTSPHLARVAI